MRILKQRINALNVGINGEPMEPTVISLFAGCGGSSLGYKVAGYHELFAIDWYDVAIKTFKLNFPEVPIRKMDITKLTGDELLQMANIGKGKLDVLDGSPPCQGFSTNGRREVVDERNDLVPHFIRLVGELEPKAFIMENVPGMAMGNMKGLFRKYILDMKKLNYHVKCKILNAMYYGIPQSRKRLIFIGLRRDLFTPNGTDFFPNGSMQLKTVKDAIGDLEDTDVPEIGHRIPPLRGGKGKIQWEKTRHGESIYGFVINKLHPNKPSPTILNSSEKMHYKVCRQLSQREYARLQSFPDDFKFINDGHEVIGNSVPPKLMEAIARHIGKLMGWFDAATK